MLPNESKHTESVGTHLKPMFDYAADILDFATNIFDPEPVLQRELPGECIRLALCIYAKLCRAYRGVVGALELSLGDIASANSRVLFESSAAFCFVFRDVVRLKRIAKGRAVSADTFGKELSIEFRCRLFELHERYERRRWLHDIDSFLSDPTIAVDLRRVVNHPEYVADIEKEVGQEWAQAIERAKDYSGVRLAGVAATLGPVFWSYYILRYRPLSWSIHAGDTWMFVVESQLENDGKVELQIEWFSALDELWLPFLDASALLLEALKVFIRRFASTQRNRMDYDHFVDRMGAMRNGFSNNFNANR